MKKTSFILAICLTLLISSIITAQTEKGKILVGADSNMNFSALTNKTKDDNNSNVYSKENNFIIAPKLGYFVINNLSLGIEVPLTFSNSKSYFNGFYDSNYSNQTAEQKHTSVVFAPFTKYYFNVNKTFKPFLQGQIGLGISKYTNTIDENNFNNYGDIYDPSLGGYARTYTSRSSIFMYGLEGGLAIFFNDKISLDIALGYSSITFKPKENNPDNFRQISSGFVSNIGFSLYF